MLQSLDERVGRHLLFECDRKTCCWSLADRSYRSWCGHPLSDFWNVKFPSDNNDGLSDVMLSFEVLTAVLLNIQICWDVILYYWVCSSHVPNDTGSCARKLNLNKLDLLNGIFQLLAFHYHDLKCCRTTFYMLGHTGWGSFHSLFWFTKVCGGPRESMKLSVLLCSAWDAI